MEDTLKALNNFGTKVVNKSKGNLKRKKKKASGKLIDSIRIVLRYLKIALSSHLKWRTIGLL